MGAYKRIGRTRIVLYSIQALKHNQINMVDIPVLVIGLNNMILLVCPPTPQLRPLDNSCDCGGDFKLEKTRKINKGHPPKNKRKGAKKPTFHRIL